MRNRTDEIIDMMQSGLVFVSPYNDNESRDMEAYNTLFDFMNFEKVWKELTKKFKKDELIQAMNDINARGYLSPINKLTAKQFSRKLGVQPKAIEEQMTLKNVLYNIL